MHKSFWFKFSRLGFFSAVLMVALAQLSFSWLNSWRKHWIPETQTQVDIPSLIINELRKVSQLNTVIFTSSSVVPAKAERIIGDFTLGKTELLYLAHGEVRAGIDLDELKAENISYSATGVEITLPPPRILDSKIDVQQSRVYHYNRGFLNLGPDMAPQLQTSAQRKALKGMVAIACSEGILEEANLKSQEVVKSLLNQAGYQQVIVKTQSPNGDSCVL